MNTTPHQTDESRARGFSTGEEAPARSDLSVAGAPQTYALERTAGPFSVRWLSADGRDEEVAVLDVHGELDLLTAPVLLEVLTPVLERGTGSVVSDLSEVSFMDSTGVHVLVDTLARLKPQNRRFAIACRERSQVHRILALVGLLDALSVHGSRDSAVTDGDQLIRSEAGRNGPLSASRSLTEGGAVDQPGNDEAQAS